MIVLVNIRLFVGSDTCGCKELCFRWGYRSHHEKEHLWGGVGHVLANCNEPMHEWTVHCSPAAARAGRMHSPHCDAASCRITLDTCSSLIHCSDCWFPVGMASSLWFMFFYFLVGKHEKWQLYRSGCQFFSFLGRLLWVDLIKWVSNVRPYVRPQNVSLISLKFGM